MSIAKNQRAIKRQLGQFLTPEVLAKRLVADLPLTVESKVLEPSFGEGSFLLALIDRFLPLYSGSHIERLTQIFERNLYGIEIDASVSDVFLQTLHKRYGCVPPMPHLHCIDFFRWHEHNLQFDFIIGNPPFGGTLDAELQDGLDKVYGWRHGEKIKKETYSFFLVKCHDLLKTGGQLRFICSDTFLTIKTMRGLRKLLMLNGTVETKEIDFFSEETKHPMLTLDYTKTAMPTDTVQINGKTILRSEVEKTGNLSWCINSDLSRYFDGAVLGDYLVASSGMTVGRNEWFLREIREGSIEEPYSFVFFDDPITLANEISRARLGKISPQTRAKIAEKEANGETRKNVNVIPRDMPLKLALPHADYCPYNKGSNAIVFSPPAYVIYWKDEGDAVYTYKKNGNWYLHGVGGKPFFKRSGITWQLIAPRLYARFLPEGYILDSGAPCAFLLPGIEERELFFILGWSLTERCSHILKTVINHTRNIQSKDFERLPYPFWVGEECKKEIISHVENLISQAKSGRKFDFRSPEIGLLDVLFEYAENTTSFLYRPKRSSESSQLALFERTTQLR